jgi:EAL domain-containing protein (putative c-di-GMP-specific phosphodiesterase class I)
MLRDALWVVAVVLPVLLALVAMVWRRAMLRARLVHRLERALRKRQFVPFVQPIVDLATGRCVGGEALMRWNHPQRGILGPGEFIDEAERTGLIVGMSELTMSLAAHQLAALAQSNPELYFSFNITPDQLRLPGFARRLAEIFNPDTVPRQQVLLELTERDFVDPVAKGQLIALRADGWRIAIDDFGTGQSSLATIESLPIDRIKIDRAFVSSIDERTLSRPVLDAIINLAHELHVPLIAEGIETRSQWDYLAARNVAYAQGYLMSKPLPVADFIRFATQSDRSVAQAPNTAAKPTQKPVNDQALQALWQQLGSTGGVEVRNRQYLLRTYANCFVGSEALDWIVQQRGVPRSEALRLARAMVAVGLVHHVVDEHDFEDAGFFYRLAPSTQTTPVTPAPEAAALRQALHQALDFPWRDHCVGLLRHRRCATGRTVVDWIVQRYPAPRAHAVAWATQLMRQGALRHVFDDQPFRDDASLYRLS